MQSIAAGVSRLRVLAMTPPPPPTPSTIVKTTGTTKVSVTAARFRRMRHMSPIKAFASPG